MVSRDPYAGADLANSRRFRAGLLMLCGLLTLTFLPFEPVDEQLSDAGWAIGGGLAILAIAVGVDELTGLGNRRAFDEVITVESAWASRHGVPLSGAATSSRS